MPRSQNSGNAGARMRRGARCTRERPEKGGRGRVLAELGAGRRARKPRNIIVRAEGATAAAGAAATTV